MQSTTTVLLGYKNVWEKNAGKTERCLDSYPNSWMLEKVHGGGLNGPFPTVPHVGSCHQRMTAFCCLKGGKVTGLCVNARSGRSGRSM